MKKLKIIIVALIFFSAIDQYKAQYTKNLLDGDWVFGIGWNIVDDNGKKFENLFGEGAGWNALAYPSAIRIEKGYNRGLSFVFNGSYNQYSDLKDINNEFNQSTTFFALDLGAKFNFVTLYDINAEWFNFATDVFDVYGAIGGGFTYRSTDQVNGAPTVNLSVGTNAYLINNWGINIDATAKFGITDFWKTATNYTQYSVGIVYILRNTKRYYGGRHHKRRY